MVVAEFPPGMELRMTLEVELDERYITPAPPISWRTQTYSLAEVVGSLHLPQVVQCDVKDCPISVDNVNFDLKQPLLLCINRTVRKICARNLSVDKPVKALREVGEPVLIPEDYKGWFAVLKDRSRVPHFPSIAAIASSRVSRFLVTTKLVGFYILSDNQGVMTYVRRELLPGDVLRAGKVYVGSTKVGKDFALFKKKKKKEVEVKFLKCTDETDREILINLDQTGTFYPISYTNGSVTGCVMQLNQILKKLYFPLDVKLVYGRIPNAPCSFSGLLRLTTSFEENTVVASTIMNYKNILLELSTQSVLSFKVAHPTRQMLESTAYQQALEMCQERAEVYVRDMKVSFDFITEPLSSASSSSENVQHANKVSPVRSNTPLLPLNKTKTPKKSDSSSANRAAQYGYIDTSGPLPPTASQSGSEDNSAEYEMIWLSSENKVKRRDKSTKDTDSESVEKRSSFRLSLEGTYLSCPIFTTDDRMKQGSVDGSSGSEPSSTTGSLEAPAEPDPPPLPPRAPRPKSKIVNSTGNKTKSQRDSIYEVLKKTQPVEQALQFVDKTSVKCSSTLSNSSSGSEHSISDRTSAYTSTNYENSLTNTSVEENWLELNGLEDLRDYDFPEPYLLTKTSESDYSPIDDCPEMARMPGARTAPGTPPSPTDVVSYYDSGSYRTVRQTDDIDDLPLGASSSHVGSTSDTGATSGVTVATAGSAVLGGSGVADATSDGSAFRGPSALTGLSVVEVSEALRRLGLKDSVVDSFTNENIDGGLLTQFDELTLQETFPSLRSIDIRKICLFIQSGWQPNV